jgi:SAM-dependent methyltransferase
MASTLPADFRPTGACEPVLVREDHGVERASERLAWAVETLAVGQGDRLLEIGCGHGVAVSPVCEQLVEGSIMAVDRSKVMVEQARRRNAEHVASGKAAIEVAALEEANFGGREFDKVFAFHVGLFWKQPERALGLVRPLLARGGALYLFQQPFRTTDVDALAGQGVESLRAAGFDAVRVAVGPQKPVPAFSVVGRKSGHTQLSD